MVESAFKESKLKFKFKKHRSWLTSELFLISFSPVGKNKVSCKHCEQNGVQSHYDNTSKFSKSRHRRKYECGLPTGPCGRLKKYHTAEQRRKAAMQWTKRWREAKRAAKKEAQLVTSPKAQPKTSRKAQPKTSPKAQPKTSPEAQP